MRGILLSLMAVMAMTTLAFADPVLTVIDSDLYVGDGYKSFIVQATGQNINALGTFEFEGSRPGGDVHQVHTGPNPLTDLTPWIELAGTPGDPMDSYIMVGSLRIPDLTGSSGSGTGGGPFVTAETIDTSTGTNQGMGTLTNLNAGKVDGYLRLAGEDYTPTDPPADETFDLFHLVIPDGASCEVTATLYASTIDGTTITLNQDYTVSTTVLCPLDGDANRDGIVDLLDLIDMATNYNEIGGNTWVDGDFTGEGDVDLLDLIAMATNYNQAADWYVAEAGGEGAAVPEPGTIVTLVLGMLCLAGYRLRK